MAEALPKKALNELKIKTESINADTKTMVPEVGARDPTFRDMPIIKQIEVDFTTAESLPGLRAIKRAISNVEKKIKTDGMMETCRRRVCTDGFFVSRISLNMPEFCSITSLKFYVVMVSTANDDDDLESTAELDGASRKQDPWVYALGFDDYIPRKGDESTSWVEDWHFDHDVAKRRGAISMNLYYEKPQKVPTKRFQMVLPSGDIRTCHVVG